MQKEFHSLESAGTTDNRTENLSFSRLSLTIGKLRRIKSSETSRLKTYHLNLKDLVTDGVLLRIMKTDRGYTRLN